MARVLLAVLLALWAGAGIAQTVAVRSGEHAQFTRLVLALPERADYTLTRSEGRADLVFADRRLSFDTAAVFERIPKTRLDGISALPEKQGLRLALACDCIVETFWFAAASLVIDIRPAPATVAARAAPVAPSGPPRRARRAHVKPRPLPTPPPHATTAARLVSRAFAAAAPPAGAGKPAAPDEAKLAESRENLIREVGRAASQGLLTPRASRPRPKPLPADAPPRPGAEASAPDAAPPMPGSHLRARTSIDRDMRAAIGARPGSGAEPCLAPARVDVTAWGDEAPFGQQLAPLRARLLGEFDIPDRRTALALARLYIFFGFGAEARQVLDQFTDPDAADPVLHAMAAILEETDTGAAAAVLSGQMTCAPAVALWSALSYPEIPTDMALDGDAVLLGLSALPAHLRAWLGPVLARRLQAAGYGRESAAARRILNRGAATATPETRLLEAEIALADGETGPGEAALSEIVAGNAGPSAEALLRLIDSRLKRGAEISYETAQLAGAYAVEYRDQPLGVALAEAYLAALAASGAFDDAFAELGRVLGETGAGRAGIRARLSGILAARATDFDFLHHALTGSVSAPDALDPAIANNIADRLFSLGFRTEAAAYVAAAAGGDAGRTRALLRARIALAEGRPRQAEVELLGRDGQDANLVRAEARAMVGEHAAARILFDAAGADEAARREAWLARDWEDLADTGETAQAALARLKLAAARPPEIADSPGILARNAAIVENSQELRTVIAGLLAATPAPQP